jgi:hypothetical protein
VAGAFSAAVYEGNFGFTLPSLLTVPGYVYDVKLTFTFGIIPVVTTALGTATFFDVYVNTVSTTAGNTQNNCVVVAGAASPNLGFTLVGV